MNTSNIKLELENEARAKFMCGRSTWHAWQKKGLIPTGVKVGPRAVRYPVNEINAVVAARVAGKSDDEIKALVIRLVEERQVAA